VKAASAIQPVIELNRHMTKIRVALLAAVAGVALAGCSGGDHADLDQELRDLTKDVRGRVPPLPQVKPYEATPYAGFDLPDPFGPAKIKLLNPQTAGGNGTPGPDLARAKEPLESFPIESLKMVGTLNREKQTFALVKAEQSIYRVRVGNYLGQNFGVVTKISEGELSLKELVQDGTGDWAERVATMVLQEVEAKR
jgi:type IV pilus assembly protein PilP